MKISVLSNNVFYDYAAIYCEFIGKLEGEFENFQRILSLKCSSESD
jgi:hypothetical protein